MAHDETDENGTPPRWAFSPRAIERVIPELLGLVKGIVCDGLVTDGELVALRDWIESHPEASLHWPGNVIAGRLIAAFEDGVMEEEERVELQAILQSAVGESNDQSGLMSRATRLPLDRPLPPVVFADREFCFTGIFAFGVRKKCEAEVVRRGGRCASSVTKTTRYLVIGLDSSPAWVGTGYGRKIEHAMRLRDDRLSPLSIISEEHWCGAMDAREQ